MYRETTFLQRIINSWNVVPGLIGRMKVKIPILIPQVQYEYETTDHTRQQICERTLESPYTFSIPAQVRGQLA